MSYWYFFIYNFIFFKFYIWSDFSINFDKLFHKKKWTKFNTAICWRCERKRRRRRRRECNWWRRAHQSSTPNFFSTETFHRNVEDAPNRRTHTVLPCVMHTVMYGDVQMMVQCGAVQGRNGRRKKHAAHRTPRWQGRRLSHRILCQVKNGSWDIVLHKITLIWCLQTDKIWY